MKTNPEVRLNDVGTLDEVVAEGATIHLEQMSAQLWFLAVEAAGRTVKVWFASTRKIEAYCEESEMGPGDPT